MSEGAWDLLQTFPSLASPPPSAPYFSHSLAVSIPLRAFLETPAMQANVSTIKVTLRVLCYRGGCDRFGNKIFKIRKNNDADVPIILKEGLNG